MAQYTLAQLNQMTQTEFTVALGNIFEHTPVIACESWPKRPFASVEALHQVMVAVMQSLSPTEQRSLICAHPDLGSRVQMTTASVQEQASAGLNQLSKAEYEQFQTLNRTYQARFQFPFIVAVKDHTKDSILKAFYQRLTHDATTEQATALLEIAKIARFRLAAMIG
ncbi:MAG: 2-oxo-4-hydroxy-4-carboxy-5-ureidoimidazoline decarboxylase [Cyanobacteria bacterium P01_H01_bin.58]